MWAIYVDGRGWVEKCEGWNLFHKSPDDATRFDTAEMARDARPGHHRDMGGGGFIGRVVKCRASA